MKRTLKRRRARGRRAGLQRVLGEEFVGEVGGERAFEALSAIAAQYGRARMVAWARAAEDDATRIMAVMLENTTLALALLRDLDDAHRSGNAKRVAKVRRRFDRVLATIEAREH